MLVDIDQAAADSSFVAGIVVVAKLTADTAVADTEVVAELPSDRIWISIHFAAIADRNGNCDN